MFKELLPTRLYPFLKPKWGYDPARKRGCKLILEITSEDREGEKGREDKERQGERKRGRKREHTFFEDRTITSY